MKRFWLAPVVSLLCLTIFATSASAECAWVLWNTYNTNRGPEHSIKKAFETQRSCEDAIPAQIQVHLSVWGLLYKTVRVVPSDPSVVRAEGVPDSPRKETDGDVMLIHVSCWSLGPQPKGFAMGAEYPRRDTR